MTKTPFKVAASLIVAASLNDVIGKDNDLPWPKLRKDMAYFQRITFKKAVIMGRKTYESLPSALTPLKHRINIIISRDPNYNPRLHSQREDYNEIQAFVVTSLEAAFALCEQNNWLDPVVMGGGEIYRQALEMDVVQTVYLTVVEIECEGDIFFKFDQVGWKRTKHWYHKPSQDNPLPFTWDVYQRAS